MAFVVNPALQTLDIFRIVEYPYRGGSPTTILNMHDTVNYSLVAGTFKITPPERRQQFSESHRRYGGSKLAQETHGNGTISAEWYIRGNTSDQAFTYVEELLKQIECVDERSQRYIAWQPAGAARPVLYRIVGPATWEPQYRWVEFYQTKTIHLAAGILVAPLAEGLPMNIADRYDVDSEADYTTETGSASNWEVANGGIHTTANFNVDHDLIHTDRNYVYGDHEGTLKIRLGSTVTGVRAGIILKGKDSQNKIRVYFRQAAATATLAIETVVAGTVTTQITVTLPALKVAGDVVYVRGWIEKNRIFASYWIDGNTPENAPDGGTAHTLSVANSAIFGHKQYGRPGVYFRLPSNDTYLEEYTNRPFHYQGSSTVMNQVLPASIPLDGDIPGTAPAKADVDVILSGHSVSAPFALMAWTPEFPPYNMVWNGDFEDDTDGWSVLAPTEGLHVAGTQINRVSTPKYAGGYAAQLDLPATLNAGGHFKLYRTFLRGVTHTAKVRLRSTSGTPSVSVGLGYDTGDFATSGSVALSSTAWTEVTASWTPAADATSAFLYIRSEAASAMGIIIDTARVYKGTDEPTLISQRDGRGGYPPFGILKAASRDSSRSSGWTSFNENSGNDYIHNNTFISGALEYVIDPSLIPADEFTDGETQVEIWARLSVNTSPIQITAQALPGNLTLPAAWRFTNEYGTAGKRIEAGGSSGADWRTVKLGTISLKSLHGESVRWRLRLGMKTLGVTSNVKVNEIYLTPLQQRALTPTGKPLDSYYPQFIASTSGYKRISHDGRGASTATPWAGWFPDSGLGGEFIELSPGANRMFIKLSNKIPDDVFSAADTNPFVAGVYVDVTPRWYLGRN